MISIVLSARGQYGTMNAYAQEYDLLENGEEQAYVIATDGQHSYDQMVQLFDIAETQPEQLEENHVAVLELDSAELNLKVFKH